MPECVTNEEFKYCTINGVFLLGDDTGNSGNALREGFECPQTVYIPRKVQGKEVKEIGQYALSFCTNIRRIIVDARITTIRNFGFGALASLEYVKLPNTLEHIGIQGVHFWNKSLGDLVTNPGTGIVVFEPNSKLKRIDSHGISYKENLIIVTCDSLKPSIDQDAFVFCKTVTIYSPFPFTLLGHHSHQYNYSESCKIKTFMMRNKLFVSRNVYFLILLIQ